LGAHYQRVEDIDRFVAEMRGRTKSFE